MCHIIEVVDIVSIEQLLYFQNHAFNYFTAEPGMITHNE
jgi:hypothetical protein